MKAIKDIILTYLAIYGLILMAPFFLALVSVPALIVFSALIELGVSEDISSGASFAAVMVSIYVFFQVFSAVRIRRIERDLQNKMDKGHKRMNVRGKV